MENSAVLKMWFDSVDTDRSGSINCQELQRALGAGNLHFTESVVYQMIKLYDQDFSGSMNFTEFCSLHQFLVLVQNSFRGPFGSGRDRLSLNEVYEALRVVGFSLDQPSFYSACQSFDKGRTGQFTLDHYMSMCIFLKSAQNLFRAFDTQRDGRVTLDFNQFVYCAANLRI
ncbi:hypothetical protein R1flu_003284 [Riccia fluitans]|uniref:EF-hand domain-containing protein n=1 Tax=Riccia fluitans TaxID=41844 RepID=A0ABD1Y9I9_9MARC